MANKLTAHAGTTIQVPVRQVWQALTDPALIKEYLFGTDTKTDWRKGSLITWSGKHEGKEYQDKGTIIDIVPEKLLHTTHFSPMTGREDKPENYHNVIYELHPKDHATEVTITQDNVANEKELKHMEKNWGMILQGMKKLLEDRQ